MPITPCLPITLLYYRLFPVAAAALTYLGIGNVAILAYTGPDGGPQSAVHVNVPGVEIKLPI